MSKETTNFYPPLEQNAVTAPPPAYPYGQQEFQKMSQPQPQPQFQPQQQQPIPSAPATTLNMPATVFQLAPVANIPIPVGPASMEMSCPQCHCRIRTQVRHRSTAKTHIACLLLSWTCCCCCLPYCMDSCRNANHFCPMCGHFIGTYQS